MVSAKRSYQAFGAVLRSHVALRSRQAGISLNRKPNENTLRQVRVENHSADGEEVEAEALEEAVQDIQVSS